LLNAREKKKSLILAGKIKNQKIMRGMKKRITFVVLGVGHDAVLSLPKIFLKKVKAQHLSG